MESGKSKTLHTLIAAIAVMVTVLSGAGFTVLSYGQLTEKVKGMDDRLARIERLLDTKLANK